MVRGKRLYAIRSSINCNKIYDLAEAISAIRSQANANFNETIEVAMNLGIDPRHSDQVVRGIVTLPHGTGKQVRVAVFAKGDKYNEAQAAGADRVGSEDLAENIRVGHIDFDCCIATPDMMGIVSKLGKVLGPRGLMPNPKLGTLTFNISEAVHSAKSGQVQFRSEKSGIVHARIGKASFADKSLIENIRVLYDAILKAKPIKSKGIYIKRIFLSSTMGVSLRINIASF